MKTNRNRSTVSSHNLFLCFCFFFDLYWSIIASQYCVSFCCTTKRVSHMYTHVPLSPPSLASLPSSLSHPSRSSQSTEPVSLCYAAASHQPTILHSVVYICQCYSHFAAASLSHPMSSSPFSVSTSLFLPCNYVHQYLFVLFCFFRFHIYALAYSICFSGLLHSVWQTLGPSTSLQITQFRFF